MTKIIQIDVVSDVVCPWCFVGKRRLEKALKEIGSDLKVEVNWKPYQLDPTIPPEGKSRSQYLADKFGDQENIDRLHIPITEAGAGEGIDFAWGDIKVSPNTLDAHRVISWAGAFGHHRQERVVERIFSAYFLEGKDIGDHATLAALAGEAGMNPSDVADKLARTDDRKVTIDEIENARKMGVTGVPCFIINEKYAVSGAQSPETLVNAIRQATDDA